MRPPGTLPAIRFGQFEVDLEDEEERQFLNNLGPNGKPMPNDFPLVTIMWRELKQTVSVKSGTTIKMGFTGKLTSEGILNFLKDVAYTKHHDKRGMALRGPLEPKMLETKLSVTSKVKLGKVDQSPPTFINGLLDVDE